MDQPNDKVTEIVRFGAKDQIAILREKKLGKIITEQVIPDRFTLERAEALLDYQPEQSLRQWCSAMALGYTKEGRRKARSQIRQTRRFLLQKDKYLAARYGTRTVNSTVREGSKLVRIKKEISPTDTNGQIRWNAPLRGVVMVNGRIKHAQKQDDALGEVIARFEAQKGRMINESELAKAFQGEL